MRSGDRFIQAFNELERLLRQRGGLGEGERRPFSQLVDVVAQKDSVIRRHRDILKRFGNLRNAIVHYREYPKHILADPRPEVIEELGAVLNYIAAPPKLIPRFQKDIRVFSVDDSLAGCLTFMKRTTCRRSSWPAAAGMCCSRPRGS